MSELHRSRRRHVVRDGRRAVVLVVSFVALMSCGGKVASEEQSPSTTLDASLVQPVVDANMGQIETGAINVADVNPGPDANWLDNETGTSSDAGTAEASSCPSNCTGGCDGGTCAVECDGHSSKAVCSDSRVVCPSGRPCKISCDGVGTCQIATILCPSDAPCQVLCNGESTCQQTTIQCPTSAACTVLCGGTSSCSEGAMRCGNGPCVTKCTGQFSQLSVVGCDPSSGCKEGCTGPTTPLSNPQPQPSARP
jgi:hypothetical protein